MKRGMRIALAGLLTLPMLIGSSAEAASVANITYVAKATISGGTICYPLLCTKGPRTFTLSTAGDNFGVGCAVAVEASAKKTPPVNAAAPAVTGSCSLTVTGALTGVLGGPWCGQSLISGVSGSATINGNTYNLTSGDGATAASSFTAAGTATKGGQAGVWAAEGAAIPDTVNKGDSCAPPGADEFIVVGTAVVTVV